MDASEKTECLNQISSQDVAIIDDNNIPPKQGKVQVCFDAKLSILEAQMCTVLSIELCFEINIVVLFISALLLIMVGASLKMY